MFIPEPLTIDVPDDLQALDAALEDAPTAAGVYLVGGVQGKPHLGRTSMLRRRLKRLLRERSSSSRLLNLRHVVRRIELWPTGSWLESTLIFYHLAREYYAEEYLDVIKLRYPSYVKLVLSNTFPRTQVTTKLGSGTSRYYGPFRSRALAEEFEHQALDLFQLRRCQDDLQPSTSHPGCIYGEMNMCLRPCQEVVSVTEYASEAHRFAEFLSTNGKHLLHATESARDRLSEELDFEGAAREHKRFERIEQALKARDDLSGDVDHLHGIAITPSAAADKVELWMMLAGVWQPGYSLDVGLQQGDEPVSLDVRLRAFLERATRETRTSTRDRQDHIALLVRWYFSSWRDGEWIAIADLEKPPIRRIVGGVSRVAAKQSALR